MGGEKGCNDPSAPASAYTDLDGSLPFHVNLTFDSSGCMVVIFTQGPVTLSVGPDQLSGTSSGQVQAACSAIKEGLQSGVVFVSSLWSGWEPGVGADCPSCSPKVQTCNLTT